ncbi:hypothetical protein B0H19DRAFT_1367922 [Mycena capillaripes]|nr:hypothetical protein B0H19DRAFT_1367922 [Mycena capillaripes]
MFDILDFTIFIPLNLDMVPSLLLFALYFGIAVPFAGVLVRYRANSTPKTGQIRLDDEAEPAGARSSDVSLGYFGMMKRVRRIEGWAGLYRGTMPSIIAICIALLSVIRGVVLIPMLIVVNRAITTPHKLSAFGARTALRVLLSPAERTQPLRLYVAPGVALAVVLEALILTSSNVLRDAVPLPLPSVIPVLLFTTALVTPLQVMRTRLTLQPRGGGPETPAPEPALDAADAVTIPVPVYSAELMEFRTDKAPYTGLLDCARKIVDEEGWTVLMRAWWLTGVLIGPLLLPPVIM